MKKMRVFILAIGLLGLTGGYEAFAKCECDASTTKKCKGEDSAGNKCNGTGKATVGFAIQ